MRDINSEEIEWSWGGSESKVGVNSRDEGPAAKPALLYCSLRYPLGTQRELVALGLRCRLVSLWPELCLLS